MKVRDIATVYKFNSVFDEIRVSARTDNYTIKANNIDEMMGKDFMDEEVEFVESAGGSLLVTTKKGNKR